VRAPFVRPGAHEGLASTLDLLPTIANLTGVAKTAVFRGVSLLPELVDGVTARPQWLVHEFYLPERRGTGGDPLSAISLRTPRYDLILERDTGRTLLYQWQVDPDEVHDLAASSEHRGARAALEAQLQKVVFGLRPVGDSVSTPRQ
jgi:arylsulfatase A-like enzyme